MFNRKNDTDKTEEAAGKEAESAPEKAAEQPAGDAATLLAQLKTERANVEQLKGQLAQAQQEKESWMNKYYSSLADVSNLRKELQRDNELATKYAAEPFLKDLIPFMTSLDQAFRFEPSDDPKAKSWVKGIHLAYKQLLQALEKQGVEQIEPKPGDRFDSRYMEAMQTVEGDKPDTIVSVWMKGFSLKGRLIQPAAVVVMVPKAPAQPQEGEAAAAPAEEKKAEETSRDETSKKTESNSKEETK